MRTNLAFKSIPCPACGAPAGRNCMRSVALAAGAWCHERMEAVHLPTSVKGLNRETPEIGSHPTAKCAQGHHGGCHGRHRPNHGVAGQRCSCGCHRTAPAGIN